MADTTALKNRIRAAIKANDNQEITGPVLQQALLDIVDELDLNPELENEAQQRQNGDTQLNNLITGIKNSIDSGYVYAGIATPSAVPVSGKVFYIATAAGTYTNFSRQVLTKGINILSNNGSAWNHQQLIGIDDEPTAGSENLVKSGGTCNMIYNYSNVLDSIQGLKLSFLLETIKPQFSQMKSAQLEQGKYWGSGGLLDYTGYYAISTLINVAPGDWLILTDVGLDGNTGAHALLGSYDQDGHNVYGGRIPQTSTIFVKDIVYNPNTKVKYVIVKIPDGVYKIGLFFKTDSIRPYSVIEPEYSVISSMQISTEFKNEVEKVIENSVIAKELDLLGDFTSNTINKFKDNDYTTGKYWGNGGLKTAEYFVALNNLIAVNPGEYIYLWNWGNNDALTGAAIGMYDNDGNDAPGRVNFNSPLIKELVKNDKGIVTYAKIQVPNGCTQVGLFYRNVSFSGDPLFRIGGPLLFTSFSDEAAAKIKYLAKEVINSSTINAEGINSDYYLKGSANKMARTKKLCIIGGGQSNIDGRVSTSNLPSYITLPMHGMNFIKNSLDGIFQDNYPSGNWGFDLVTCYYLIQNLGSDNLYYIKWSNGGTSIDKTGDGTKHWTADYEELPSLSDSLLLDFNKEIEKCNNVNPNEYEIGAMIWHQGESDRASYSQEAAANYYDNFKKLIAFCRGITGNAVLPFICGTISHNSGQYDTTVDAAIRRIGNEDPYVFVVDMTNAVLQDGFHFNAAWSEYFGKKVYDYLIDANVITGTKLNPSEPS